jgi:hypothetical protein
MSLDGVLVWDDLANDFSRRYYGDWGRRTPNNTSFDDGGLIFERSERQLSLQTARFKPEIV